MSCNGVHAGADGSSVFWFSVVMVGDMRKLWTNAADKASRADMLYYEAAHRRNDQQPMT